MTNFYRFAAGLALVLAPGTLLAGDGNYQDYIVGERAAGMGGAVVALAQSVDACYFNPAGIAFAPANSISVSASLYGFYNFKVEDGWFPSQNMDIDSFVSIPSTFGSIMKLGDTVVAAFSAFIPDRSSSNDLQSFSGPDHFFKYSLEDQSLWIGPSLACQLSPDLSLGISVFGVYRTHSFFRDYLFLSEEKDVGVGYSGDIKYHDLSLLSVLGIRYQLGGDWLAGFSVQTPALHLQGDGEYLFKLISPDEVVGVYIPTGETRNNLPTAFRAGLGCQVPLDYAFGLDVSYHLPTSYSRFSGEDRDGVMHSYDLRREGTFNLNLGGEYYVVDRYPVRLGFFTNLSAAPHADPGNPEADDNPPHIDKYGLTASLGRETENSTVNFGINYGWGKGDFYGISPEYLAESTTARESYLYIFFASSYLF